LGSAATYGVEILRADVKDLTFPGNLQEIMNRVLATERLSGAQLVEARTKAEAQRIEAAARAESPALESAAELDAMRQCEQVAQVFTKNPARLRPRELEALRELSQVANAHIYISSDKHAHLEGHEPPPRSLQTPSSVKSSPPRRPAILCRRPTTTRASSSIGRAADS
jgi:hypothetical protein